MSDLRFAPLTHVRPGSDRGPRCGPSFRSDINADFVILTSDFRSELTFSAGMGTRGEGEVCQTRRLSNSHSVGFYCNDNLIRLNPDQKQI
jgi:hypothetical protein